MTPILWSFRRCPYAMRARLALHVAQQPVELREIVLRAKPEAFLATSPSGTVPCLDTGQGVIDESLDIMIWALERRDPEGWLAQPHQDLIARCDGPFKAALDRTKYANRYPDADPTVARQDATAFLMELNGMLSPYLGGPTPCLADMAILPFVRQFAHIDLAWFEAQEWPRLIAWVAEFKASNRFAAIMSKYAPWTPDAPGVPFPEVTHAS